MSDTIKGGGLSWHVGQGLSKDQWLEAEPKDGLPARIKQLDGHTFACYRGGKYLGCEPTLQEAFKRIEANTLSEKNRVMAIWQRQHPDELPPGLQLTDAERAEYWRHNPVAGRGAVATRGAAQLKRSSEGGGQRNEVDNRSAGVGRKPAPTKSPPRAAVARDAAPSPEIHPGTVATTAKKEKSGNARVDKAAIAKMLERGCTSEEVLKFTGWKAISMPAMAKSIGVGLRIDKSRKPFKYYSTGKESKK